MADAVVATGRFAAGCFRAPGRFFRTVTMVGRGMVGRGMTGRAGGPASARRMCDGGTGYTAGAAPVRLALPEAGHRGLPEPCRENHDPARDMRRKSGGAAWHRPDPGCASTSRRILRTVLSGGGKGQVTAGIRPDPAPADSRRRDWPTCHGCHRHHGEYGMPLFRGARGPRA